MLIAIERTQFNYLYKQDSIPADISKIYWHDKKVLLSAQTNALEKAIVELDSILPPFQEDHEVILLEYDSNIWEFNEYKQLEFSGVLSIIPLTKTGKLLLAGKLNPKMNISEPIFQAAVEGAKNKRNLKLGRHAAKVILSLFNLDNPPVKAVTLIEQAIVQINNNSKQPLTNIFHTLFSYNTTEGFIPEGNAEYLCKIAVLARLHIGEDPSKVKEGPYYKNLLTIKNSLNKYGLFEAFQWYMTQNQAAQTTSKIKEIINLNLEFDMFFVAYSFFAFRRILNKNDNDLNTIKSDIIKMKDVDPIAASVVMYAIGTFFSFDQLYESMHILGRAPLLTPMHQTQRPNPIIPYSLPPKMKSEYWNTLDEISTSEKQQESQQLVEDIQVCKNNDELVSEKIPDSANAPKINRKNETDFNSESVAAETESIEKAPERTWPIVNDNTSVSKAHFEEQQVINTQADNLHIPEVEKEQVDVTILETAIIQDLDSKKVPDQESISNEKISELIERVLDSSLSIDKNNVSLGNADFEEQQVINTQEVKIKIPDVEKVQTNDNIEALSNAQNPDNTKVTDKNSMSKEMVIDQIKENSKCVSVQSFKDFFSQQNFKNKKDKEILTIVEAYESELENGITFEWLNNKLFPADSAKDKNKISANCIKSIKGFFIAK